MGEITRGSLFPDYSDDLKFTVSEGATGDQLREQYVGRTMLVGAIGVDVVFAVENPTLAFGAEHVIFHED